jgi:hypothetical protein
MWKGKEPGEADLRLALYNGDVAVEVPMLWSLGKELDGGFRDVRALKDIRYTLNAMDYSYTKLLPPFQNIRCFRFVKQMYLDTF